VKKIVLVIGTGTIGEPLIGLLADFKKKLRLDEIIFHKRTPLIDEIAKVNSLIKRGARLAVDKDKKNVFKKLGHKVSYTFEDALKKASVVIDCTPAGNEHKEKHYKNNPNKLYIAQGSEKDFGLPYAYGINDVIFEQNPNFVQVVSCNTHNIASIIKAVDPSLTRIEKADFVCIRRANDISQDENFIASPQVGSHKYANFGTHHAKDAYDLFCTLNKRFDMFSSALKINSQYMHLIRFNIVVYQFLSSDSLIERFKENKFIAISYKTSANKVFSFGRDHGYYGRIFNQTVVPISSVMTAQKGGKTQVTGFCFTPQDGNSLLSSIAACLWGIYKEDYLNYMQIFDEFLFDEV
jgi:glyceraldehyde-3-phosphate dehydrogenase (NAD(P))